MKKLTLPHDEMAWIRRSARESGKTVNAELADLVRAMMATQAAYEEEERKRALLPVQPGTH